ncbi:MAG: glycoside hydrolase family 19 protein [Magnetospirillum sp.]|nr:glycoside hydrolase family 19 protein [Magnetospirillum sp.]
MDERQARAADVARIGGVLPETVAAVTDAIAAAGGNALACTTFAGPLAVACKRFDILTRLRLAHFVAQLGHESGGFSRVEENLNYTAVRIREVWGERFATNAMAEPYARNPIALANLVYASRNGNGPVASGDGWTYRGRGLIQLTGRRNYRAAGAALGIPLEADPEQARSPWNAGLIAGWFWQQAKCNAHADKGEAGLAAVTRAINGGQTGLQDRANRYERALAALAAHPETLEA